MSDEPREPTRTPALPPVTRRNFLFKLGLGLNALAAGLVAVPLVGYVLSAVVQTPSTGSLITKLPASLCVWLQPSIEFILRECQTRNRWRRFRTSAAILMIVHIQAFLVFVSV